MRVPILLPMRLLLALSFSLAAAQPALRGADEGTRALLFSNYAAEPEMTVTPTAGEATSAGTCYYASTDHSVVCDVDELACIDANSGGDADNIWYEPGYMSDYTGCCTCRASCDHDAETGTNCGTDPTYRDD